MSHLPTSLRIIAESAILFSLEAWSMKTRLCLGIKLNHYMMRYEMALQEFNDPVKSRKQMDEDVKPDIGYGEG